MITDLADNFNILDADRPKTLTQTSCRPVRVLCATKIAESMREALEEHFDILLYVEEEKNEDSSSQHGNKSHLVKEFHSETANFIEWNDQLNHYAYERYEKDRIEYMEKCKQKKLSSEKALKDRNLSQLRVLKKGDEENIILSLTFQFNQLLMLINNPMLFPHRAYASMFTVILGGTVAGKGDLE